MYNKRQTPGNIWDVQVKKADNKIINCDWIEIEIFVLSKCDICGHKTK